MSSTDPASPPPAPMRSVLRWSLGLAAVVLVGLLALAGIARALFDEETLKRELAAKLGRSVAYSRLDPGFFSFGIEGLVVGDTAGFHPDPLLEAPRLEMSYSLLSLLVGKLRIASVTLGDAIVRIERDTAGRTSVDDLIAPSAGEGLVQLEALTLQNCRFVVRDPSGEYALGSVNGVLGRLSTSQPVFALSAVFLDRPLAITEGRLDLDAGSVALRARLEGLPLETLPVPSSVFDVRGLSLDADVALSATPDSATVDGTIAAGGDRITLDLALAWKDGPTARGTVSAELDVATLRRAAALRAPLDEVAASGRLGASVRLDGPLDRVPASVNGRLLGLSLKPPGFSARLEDLRGAFRASPEELVLESVTLAASGMRLGVTGRVGLVARTLDLAVKGDPVDFAALARLLDPPVLPAGVTVSGGGAVDIRLTGAMASPAVRGTVRLDGVDAALADPPAKLDQVRGNLQLAGDRIVIPRLEARLGSGSLSATGSYLVGPGTFDLGVKAVGVDLAALPASLGVSGLRATGLAGFDGTIAGTAAAPRVSGVVSSPSLTFFGVDVTELSGRLLYDKDALRIDDFQARLLGGILKGDATAALGDAALPFTADVRAEALGLPQLLRAVAGYSGATSGTLGATLSLSGKGADRGTYTGIVSTTVSEAGFGAIPALEQLAPFLGIAPEKLRTVRNGSASFSVANGLARLSRPLRLEGAGYAVTAEGALGLDGALQLACKADLPTNSVVGRVGGHSLAQILGVRQAGERTVIPFTASGTLFAPRFGLDVKTEDVVGGLVQEGLGRVGGENADAVRQAADVLLGGQRPGGTHPPSPSGADSPSTTQGTVRSLPQDAVFGVIDGLLGRRRTPAPTPAPTPAAPAEGTAPQETEKK